jgi:hypothetical protein
VFCAHGAKCDENNKDLNEKIPIIAFLFNFLMHIFWRGENGNYFTFLNMLELLDCFHELFKAMLS